MQTAYQTVHETAYENAQNAEENFWNQCKFVFGRNARNRRYDTDKSEWPAQLVNLSNRARESNDRLGEVMKLIPNV